MLYFLYLENKSGSQAEGRAAALEWIVNLMLALPQSLPFPEDVNSKETVRFFLKLLQVKNRSLYLHSLQVANYAISTAAKLGLSRRELAAIKNAALLHDIGKLGVPNNVLIKVPYLSSREASIYKRHPIAGASMLENILDLDEVAVMIRCHHEKWDGSGFPKRLKGQNIPLGARIIAVADYYDAFVNPCTQHWQKSHAEALGEIQDKAGQAFDPVVVRAFIESVVPVPDAILSAKSPKEK